MWPLFIVCVCVQTATGAIDIINTDMSNREPKIISQPFQVPNKVNENSFLYNPVEEVPFHAEGVSEITKGGQIVVNSILGQLLQSPRGPVALLVQDNEQTMRTAAIYMHYAMQNPSMVRRDFWLMKFNASGVSNIISKTSLVEPGAFLALLQGSGGGGPTTSSKHLGLNEGEDSAVVFFSILKATRILPFGASILLFVNSRVEDEDLAQLALRETMNKEIRILAVWVGPGANTNNQREKLIREATTLTHGAWFIGNTERKSTNDLDLQILKGNVNPVITHLVNQHGPKQVRVPIEEDVHAIHVSLTNNVNRAHFYTPQGYLIDLLNITEVARFGRDSYVVKTGETFEIELAHERNNNAVVVGVWRLETDAFAQHYYNIIVSVRHDMTIETKLNVNKNIETNRTGGIGSSRILHLNVQGAHATIEDVTLLTANGISIKDGKLKINIVENIKNEDDIETFTPGSNVDIDVASLPPEPVYIQIRGKDKTGHDFQRISYFNPRNIHNVIQPTSINLGAGSDLYQVPGRASNILYEVSNNRDHVILMRFEARDERRYLRRMFPLWAWVNPHQTVVVTLTTIAEGGTDLITFSAWNGADRVDKTALVRSESGRVHDDESPHMWHKFTSDCLQVVFGRCEDHSWTIEVTAQDKETGLMLVTSSPEGLYFPNGYTSGTTEEVTGILGGSCCKSSIVLTAIDAVNNRRSYVADAYWAPLGAGAIAAIVLGVIIFIVLILLLIYCCIWGSCKCGRKQKYSVDLPTTSARYQGPANSSSTRRY